MDLFGEGATWGGGGSQPDQTLPAHTDYSHPLWSFAHAIMAQTVETWDRVRLFYCKTTAIIVS